MSLKSHPSVGQVWLPNRSLSVPARAVHQKPTNIVVATIRRPAWAEKGLIKLPDVQNPYPDGRAFIERALAPFRVLLDPADFLTKVVWASVTHNERVDDGAGHNVNRMFGTVGASNGVGSVVAVADQALTRTKTDRSLESITQGVTTSEFTTIGLSRAAGTVQNYVAPSTLNGTFSADVFKSFSVTGTGTAFGSGLFDQVVVAGSFLLVEDDFASSASVVNGDTLEITWTWTH